MGNQFAGIVHRFCGGLILPAIGAKMIATQNELLMGKIQPGGHLEYEVAKRLRRHSRVAAKLINLIGGRFNQQKMVMSKGIMQGGFQHHGVCGAHRIYSFHTALLMRSYNLKNIFHFLLHNSV